MTDEYYELIYDKARSYGIAGREGRMYSGDPVRLRRSTLTDPRADSDPAKQRAAEPVVFTGPAGTYHRRLYEPDVSEMSRTPFISQDRKTACYQK